MKNIIGSKIQIVECATAYHNGLKGMVESKRREKGFNVRLQCNEMCVAYKVKTLKPKESVRQGFIRNMLASVEFYLGGGING